MVQQSRNYSIRDVAVPFRDSVEHAQQKGQFSLQEMVSAVQEANQKGHEVFKNGLLALNTIAGDKAVRPEPNLAQVTSLINAYPDMTQVVAHLGSGGLGMKIGLDKKVPFFGLNPITPMSLMNETLPEGSLILKVLNFLGAEHNGVPSLTIRPRGDPGLWSMETYMDLLDQFDDTGLWNQILNLPTYLANLNLSNFSSQSLATMTTKAFGKTAPQVSVNVREAVQNAEPFIMQARKAVWIHNMLYGMPKVNKASRASTVTNEVPEMIYFMSWLQDFHNIIAGRVIYAHMMKMMERNGMQVPSLNPEAYRTPIYDPSTFEIIDHHQGSSRNLKNLVPIGDTEHGSYLKERWQAEAALSQQGKSPIPPGMFEHFGDLDPTHSDQEMLVFKNKKGEVYVNIRGNLEHNANHYGPGGTMHLRPGSLFAAPEGVELDLHGNPVQTNAEVMRDVFGIGSAYRDFQRETLSHRLVNIRDNLNGGKPPIGLGYSQGGIGHRLASEGYISHMISINPMVRADDVNFGRGVHTTYSHPNDYFNVNMRHLGMHNNPLARHFQVPSEDARAGIEAHHWNHFSRSPNIEIVGNEELIARTAASPHPSSTDLREPIAAKKPFTVGGAATSILKGALRGASRLGINQSAYMLTMDALVAIDPEDNIMDEHEKIVTASTSGGVVEAMLVDKLFKTGLAFETIAASSVAGLGIVFGESLADVADISDEGPTYGPDWAPLHVSKKMGVEVGAAVTNVGLLMAAGAGLIAPEVVATFFVLEAATESVLKFINERRKAEELAAKSGSDGRPIKNQERTRFNDPELQAEYYAAANAARRDKIESQAGGHYGVGTTNPEHTFRQALEGMLFRFHTIQEKLQTDDNVDTYWERAEMQNKRLQREHQQNLGLMLPKYRTELAVAEHGDRNANWIMGQIKDGKKNWDEEGLKEQAP